MPGRYVPEVPVPRASRTRAAVSDNPTRTQAILDQAALILDDAERDVA